MESRLERRESARDVDSLPATLARRLVACGGARLRSLALKIYYYAVGARVARRCLLCECLSECVGLGAHGGIATRRPAQDETRVTRGGRGEASRVVTGHRVHMASHTRAEFTVYTTRHPPISYCFLDFGRVVAATLRGRPVLPSARILFIIYLSYFGVVRSSPPLEFYLCNRIRNPIVHSIIHIYRNPIFEVQTAGCTRS